MINSSFLEILLIPVNLTNQVTQAFESIKTSLNATTNKAVNPALEATGQVIDTLTDTAHKTQDSLKQTANQFMNTMGETSEQGKVVLGNTFQTAEHLSNAFSKNIEQAINAVLAQQMNDINAWINAHPALSWLTQSLVWGINHPILGLILLFFALFLIWQLFKVMGYWFEQALVALLKAPFQFIWFILTLSFKFLRKPTTNNAKIQQTEVKSLALSPAIPALTTQEHQERVVKILTRIEVLRQEQNDLLQELTAILVSDKLSVD
jgi:hypothetical protein